MGEAFFINVHMYIYLFINFQEREAEQNKTVDTYMKVSLVSLDNSGVPYMVRLYLLFLPYICLQFFSFENNKICRERSVNKCR